MKKKIAAILFPLIACSTAAMAQEASPADRWEGPYVGVHLGGTWIDGDMTAYTPYNSYNGFSVADLNDGSISGGAQIGYNHQIGNLGIGAEAMVSFTDNKRASYDNAPDTLFWRKASLSASIAPRVSYATQDVILYAKAGLAMAKFEVGHNQNGNDIEAKDTQYGYALGAGGEYALTPRISAGVQYDFMDFGNASTHISSPNSDISVEQGGALHSVRAVLNYHF